MLITKIVIIKTYIPYILDKTRALFEGLQAGDRSCLARSITLVESTNK